MYNNGEMGFPSLKREQAKKKAEENSKARRRPLSAAPAPTERSNNGRMARPKSVTSLPSELLRSSEAAAVNSRGNTTSELRERCNRQRIRERDRG